MCAKQWNEEIKIDGVTYPADQLNRKQDAELLTKILVRRSNSNREKPNKSSYVINVNAEWGAGKTYFVKRWAEDLKHEHPVVYIDAWSNDFMDSPIITVLAEIQEQLLETINKSHLTQAKRKSFKNIGISVLPKILAALVKRYGGFDIEDLFVEENSDTDTSSSTKNSKSLDLSAAMEAMTTQAFKEHSDYKKGVKELKGTIKELVKYSIDKPKGGLQAIARSYPAFIFIDELDRCRPTYAVEMLEAIKHIFDIEGLVIVVSTHTEELQHTIKALYGNDFNADSYLRRFFDTKFHLGVDVSSNLLKSNCDLSVLNYSELVDRNIILFPFLNFNDGTTKTLQNNVIAYLTSIAKWLDLSPRSAIQLAERFTTCIELIEENNTVDVSLVGALLALYMFQHDAYVELKKILLHSLVTNQPFYINSEEHIYTLLDSFKNILETNIAELGLECCLKYSQKFPQVYEVLPMRFVHNGGFNKITLINEPMNLYDYLDIFLKTYEKNDVDLRKSEDLTRVVGYDGKYGVEPAHALSVLMLFYGTHKKKLAYYLELVELTSRFDDSTFSQ